MVRELRILGCVALHIGQESMSYRVKRVILESVTRFWTREKFETCFNKHLYIFLNRKKMTLYQKILNVTNSVVS
ncbi:hypothetical protein C1645_785172 [Glomus cerebriforme]|uniref:Uncharacterized protein n=1 Tax=Glomus cerebriforme TaxID=658196 RepID=A0A397SEK3_9GLOM|nr:hypothetical protein C1645_785172 [Glomus cerebriforme]